MQPLARRFVVLALLAFAFLPVSTAHAADAPAVRPLRVCLVFGSQDSKPYSTDDSLAALARYLEAEHKMTCTLLTWDAASAGFKGIERLLEADAAPQAASMDRTMMEMVLFSSAVVQ